MPQSVRGCTASPRDAPLRRKRQARDALSDNRRYWDIDKRDTPVRPRCNHPRTGSIPPPWHGGGVPAGGSIFPSDDLVSAPQSHREQRRFGFLALACLARQGAAYPWPNWVGQNESLTGLPWAPSNSTRGMPTSPKAPPRGRPSTTAPWAANRPNFHHRLIARNRNDNRPVPRLSGTKPPRFLMETQRARTVG